MAREIGQIPSEGRSIISVCFSSRRVFAQTFYHQEYYSYCKCGDRTWPHNVGDGSSQKRSENRRIEVVTFRSGCLCGEHSLIGSVSGHSAAGVSVTFLQSYLLESQVNRTQRIITNDFVDMWIYQRQTSHLFVYSEPASLQVNSRRLRIEVRLVFGCNVSGLINLNFLPFKSPAHSSIPVMI